MVSPVFEMMMMAELAALVIAIALVSSRLVQHTQAMTNAFLGLCAELHEIRTDLTIHARLLSEARRRDGMYGPLPWRDKPEDWMSPDYPGRKPDATDTR